MSIVDETTLPAAAPPREFAAVQAQYGGKYEYRPEAPQGLYRGRPQLVFRCALDGDRQPPMVRATTVVNAGHL